MHQFRFIFCRFCRMWRLTLSKAARIKPLQGLTPSLQVAGELFLEICIEVTPWCYIISLCIPRKYYAASKPVLFFLFVSRSFKPMVKIFGIIDFNIQPAMYCSFLTVHSMLGNVYLLVWKIVKEWSSVVVCATLLQELNWAKFLAFLGGFFSTSLT